MEPLILIANPGSESRKYALYRGQKCIARVHFEHEGKKIVYSLEIDGKPGQIIPAGLDHLTFAPTKVWEILENSLGLKNRYDVKAIALRIVAPSKFFQEHRLLDRHALLEL